jgi:hypothetical protein
MGKPMRNLAVLPETGDFRDLFHRQIMGKAVASHSSPKTIPNRARFPWAARLRCAASSVSLPLGRAARASMGPSPNKTVETPDANARIWWLTRPGASCILRSAEPLRDGSGPSPPPFAEKNGGTQTTALFARRLLPPGCIKEGGR